jgi:hypothetical protein
MSPIAAIESGAAENFSNELGHDHKVRRRHICKYWRKDSIGWNSFVKPHEKRFEPFDAAYPVVQRGNFLGFHHLCSAIIRRGHWGF